jgi:phosphoenolpyruvate-protein phosphotransferase
MVGHFAGAGSFPKSPVACWGNAWLNRAMKNSLQELRKVVQEAAVASTPLKRARVIVAGVKEAMNVAVCSLYLLDEDDWLTLAATEGLNPEAVGKVRLKVGDGLVGTIAKTRHPLNLESASSDPHYLYFPETGEEKFEGFVGAPVVHLGELVGVLVVEECERRRFSEEEESFLVTVAAHLGTPDPAGLRAEAPGGVAKPRRVIGIRGASGIGIGNALILSAGADLSEVPDEDVEDPAVELAHFRAAVTATLADFARGGEQVAAHVPKDVAGVFTVYEMLLQSREFVEAVEKGIGAGNWAPGALRAAVDQFARLFEGMEDEYLRGRGEDIRHLGNRVYQHLREIEAPVAKDGEPIILVGNLVSVADIAAFPIAQLAGIVSVEGSVLANALGIPAVMGVESIHEFEDGETAIVDGYSGRVMLSPTKGVIKEYRNLLDRDRQLFTELEKLKDLPAETPDGTRVRLYANTGLLADMTPGLARGAEGIGLYRSEIPFLVRDSFPSEDEQYEVYRAVLQAYEGKPVSMRTLDIGGDKTLPYYPIAEDNPALGWRGIRFTLDNSTILMTQVRAMLRASAGLKNLRIMLPMVSRVDEVDRFRALLDSALEQLREEGIKVARPKVGIMVEVPAALTLLSFVASKIDFISIGSNDLSQYLLAVDRTNPRVSRLFDHLHPAVLHAVHWIVAQARRNHLATSLCGEMGADPCAVVLLLGMGIESLSMSAFSLPKIKWLIRTVPRALAVEQLELALKLDHEKAIRQQVSAFLRKLGLGDLLPPET